MVGAAEDYQNNSLFVTNPSGAMHCEPNFGIDLSTRGQQLTEAGVMVISMRMRFDGREGVADRGSPTGETSVYGIAATKINTA